jgi:hypothetical protein
MQLQLPMRFAELELARAFHPSQRSVSEGANDKSQAEARLFDDGDLLALRAE